MPSVSPNGGLRPDVRDSGRRVLQRSPYYNPLLPRQGGDIPLQSELL